MNAGETLSHYRILDRLGEGAMGAVYLAEDLRLHRPVALKTLRPDVRCDDSARARLLREARAASALNHPNIAVIYEMDEVPDEGGPPLRFIAMEYVAGQTLARLAEARLDIDTVLDIVMQVAEALAEAHARGVVHRDIKPSNVMVTESRRVKVLDFGLAKLHPLTDDTGSTWSRDAATGSGAGALIGTVAYMSPEQALGREVDARSDVFSLGVVLYELLGGRLPFTGSNAVEVFDAILRSDPPPLALATPDPRQGDVEGILRRMLAKKREDRYPDLRTVLSDLSAVARGAAPRGAMPPPALAHAVAILGFANIRGDGEDDWLGTGIAETVTADIKGSAGLAVIARERVHEVLRRLGEGATAPDAALAVRVGRELGVRFVLGGGFQRNGEVVRVTAWLSDVEKGDVVSMVKLDGRIAEIFDLQDRIVRSLSQSLMGKSAPLERPIEETQVLPAYEAFSKGVLNLQAETYESFDRAVLLFERAIALDPGYARAHLELGSALSSKADYLQVVEFHERALASFRRAIDLRPGLVRAWRELGASLVSLGREDEGIEAIRRALELDPADAGALQSMARALFIGKAEFPEAARYYERSLEKNPQAGWSALQLAHCCALLRDFERGERAGRRAAELQEAFVSGQERVLIVGAHMRLGQLAFLQGRPAEAFEAFQRELAFLQKVDHALRTRIMIELSMRLGWAQHSLGREGEARAAFDSALAAFERRVRMGADDPFTRYYVACIQALRGESELAIASLEKAASMRRRFTVVRARTDAAFDGLRGEPRFAALVAER
jgi:tetratricopeptide (TPR) repeat protein/predicted Ser/Thr protein kinase